MKISIELKGTICIYKVVSPSGKIYIGQTWCLWNRYKSGVSKHQRLLYRSYLKYGSENHQLEILKTFESLATQKDLDYWEAYFMKAYKDLGFTLLNIREAGSRGKNALESIERGKVKKAIWVKNNPGKVIQMVAKAAEKNRGKTRTEETKQKISEANKGKVKSEQHCRNVSLGKKGKPSGMKGRTFSEEAKLNMSIGVRKTIDRLYKPIIQLSLEGEEIARFPSIIEANKSVGKRINGCLRGHNGQKTAAGFKWKYA